MKQLFRILLILFFSSLAFLALYNFVILPYQKDKDRPGPPNASEDNEEYRNKVFEISSSPVLGAAISQDKSHIVYYLKENGNIKQTDLDGQNIKTISSFYIANLSSAKWSPNKNMVVCSKLEGNKEIQYIYNYSTKKSYDLSSRMRNVCFSKNNSKIAYNYASDKENNISISDTDGTNWDIILNTRLNNPSLEWIDNLKIAVYEWPTYKNTSSVLIVNTSNFHLDRILSGKNGLSAKFSPDSKKVFYTYADSSGKNFKSGILEMEDKKESALESATLVEKCVWSQNNKDLYCAIPENLPYSEMPNKYYQSSFSTKDIFVKINSETNAELVILPKIASIDIDASELFLSPTEDRLYFTNKYDGFLYGLQL